ncbi:MULTISPECIES: CaiB/BaiF CoA-transferase family protein [unclassified Sporosarcina]|uniref:CaiB/BaiF CoA transferase family protein n=1 Tax=unclassified Sporosarcina TaxID=2647733 RepID=UPI00203D7BD6|nr:MULTISPECIES: CaiB/BaiF CoA-transferase family protein [unclassified Sporosarcina]GKV64485.1 CoA transferase [Sporosarcina sp. NCCP-2331]GLB57517.1 CoA transferase [Sporosarcina sp. NCCP-2378]
MLPLEGITVVSLEQAVAAPFATRQLADLGARVIKIERPISGDFARHYDTTVDGLSSHFVWINRSKESLTLNLKSDEGKEILHKLLSEADVFIQNLAPGAVDRLGFSPQVLKEKYEKLIVCGISGYGSYGPYVDKKAYDLLIQCEAGLVSTTGTEDTPSKAGVSVADIAAGMYAYTGILTAIIQRSRTGKGSVFEVSMLEALGEWMGYPLYYSHYGGTEPARSGASHATIFPYGPFPAKDEKFVFFSIQNDREWASFSETVMKRPDLITDEKYKNNSARVGNKEELKKIIEEGFSAYTADELIELLEKAKIANARLNSVEEFVQHPQLQARNRWRDVKTPNGMIQALLPPATFEDFEPVMEAIPSVGENTDSILREFNFDEDFIQKCKDTNTI